MVMVIRRANPAASRGLRLLVLLWAGLGVMHGAGCGESHEPPREGAVEAVGAAVEVEGESVVESASEAQFLPELAAELPPEPVLKMGAGFTFDPDAAWFGLEGEALEAVMAADRPRRGTAEQRRAWLQAGAPVSVVHLGERLRIYNLAGQWRPMTVGLVDEEGRPRWTVRLDLPPTGVVRGTVLALEQASEDEPLNLQLTRPSDWVDGAPLRLPLYDRQIGTPSEPMTSETASALGYGTSTSWKSQGVDGMPAEAFQASGAAAFAALPGAVMEGKSWSAGTQAVSIAWRTTGWKAALLADRNTEFASHGLDEPDETWWIDQVLHKLWEQAENQRKRADKQPAAE